MRATAHTEGRQKRATGHTEGRQKKATGHTDGRQKKAILYLGHLDWKHCWMTECVFKHPEYKCARKPHERTSKRLG